MSGQQTIDWLRGLAAKGGKGVVNNIDARCIGRIADDLEYLRTLALNAVREYPVASGLYVDPDGQAGYGSLKAMRLHLRIEPEGSSAVVAYAQQPGSTLSESGK